MKHLKTQQQLNETQENLNISDVSGSKIMEDKFNEKDMIKFLTWVNVRCELTCWLGEYVFKGIKYNAEEIYKIYMETYFEKQI